MKKLFNQKSYIAIVAVVSVVLTATLMVNTGCEKQPEEIKIGAILPLTGSVATLGEWMMRGHQLAVEDINRTGGINGKKIKLIIEDGMGDPKSSVTAFKKLVEIEKVKIIIGAVSPVCLALKPLANESKILLFANAGHPQITGESKYIFRHSNTAEEEANIISRFILENPELKKGTVIATNDDYGIAFTNTAEKILNISHNIEIEKLIYEVGEEDFKIIAQKVIRSSPDFIIIGGADSKGIGLLVKRLREYNYEGLVATTLVFGFPDAIKAAGPASEGVFYTDFVIDSEDSLYVRVNNEYKKIYNSDIPPVSLFEYNTIKLIYDCIKAVGYNPDKISDYLLMLKTYNGVGEKIRITSHGDLVPEMYIKKYDK